MSQAPCKCRIIEHNDMEASSNFSAPFYVPNPVKCYIAFFSKDTIHQTQKNVYKMGSSYKRILFNIFTGFNIFNSYIHNIEVLSLSWYYISSTRYTSLNFTTGKTDKLGGSCCRAFNTKQQIASMIFLWFLFLLR